MAGMIVAALLAAACGVLGLRRTTAGWSVRLPRNAGTALGGLGSHDREYDLHGGEQRFATSMLARGRQLDAHELPLFVHQLAGLLRAGRPPHVLWADMERVHAEGRTSFSVAALPVIATARRAAHLGLSVPAALRDAAADTGQQGTRKGQTDRMWSDLAGCLEVAERSGAPLAGILEHYAAQLDAQLDGVSTRETALAGPRATVVLLAWLPAVGLVLGFALGINPLEVLVASSLGRLALVAGVLLMVLARMWSRRLVQQAGGEASR